ncbi:hypothetical protein F5Y00DRAFT_273107 [Daldinia vernicosa]|uniref:uncharacterized protein n=1 Tax=Daldinia vernicosa TaxID=114800 RepID=UPI0020078973|nr:uncharacterized protein F5Y00DRAFT_273107 [Daldinia vernicosa]KAI0852495.1 hypothetical protein F5Y00DRAFT_273107 [Daldinia vernicosa]
MLDSNSNQELTSRLPKVGRHTGTKKSHDSLTGSRSGSSSRLKTVPALTSEELRILSTKTEKLILKHNQLNKGLLRENEKTHPGPDDQLSRKKLLRGQKHLKKKAAQHIKKLFHLKELCRKDPSSKQEQQLYDNIQLLHSRFNEHLGPLLVSHNNSRLNTIDEKNTGKMNFDEESSMSLPCSEAPGQSNDSTQDPMLSGYSAERASASEEVCGGKRKSEDNDGASGKKRKQSISDEVDASAGLLEMPLVPTTSDEKNTDAQEAGNALSSNSPGQSDDSKSSGKQKVEAKHQEQQSGASHGYQQSYPVANSITANASTSTHGAQAADREKLEQRRRLDEIVKDHIDDFGIVYDRPGVKTSGVFDNRFWMMSGGLVTDPLQVEGIWRNSASTSDLSTPASSPTLHTMQAQLRQPENSAHPTRIGGPSPPQYFDRVMPTVTPTFAPTTPYDGSQMGGSVQEEDDEDEDDYYAGPANGNPFGIPTSYPTIQPESQTQSRAGVYSRSPSVFTHASLRPSSSPIPQPVDDLVVLVGVPGVGIPGVGVPGTGSAGRTPSSSSCPGRCINRQIDLAEALARDRMVLQKEKELWTMMMGF